MILIEGELDQVYLFQKNKQKSQDRKKAYKLKAKLEKALNLALKFFKMLKIILVKLKKKECKKN